MLRRITAILCAMIMLVPLMTGCTTVERKSVSRTFFMFDTVVSITLYGTDDEGLIEDCRSFLEGFEDVFSATSETSELYKVNHAEYADGADTEISADLYTAISRSLEWCNNTNGRFDITVRPVSELYNFGTEDFTPPLFDDIKEGMKRVSYKAVKVYEKDGKYYLHRDMPGMMLDLGAVSKGYISDRLREHILSLGIESALIDLGGNICGVGEKYNAEGGKTPFRIEVYNPLAGVTGESSDENNTNGIVPCVLKVSDRCVITSGVYQRCANVDGLTYHHLLDARTGLPADGNVESVTIICREGLMGDIFSTSLFLMAEEGLTIALPEDTGAVILYKDGTYAYQGNALDLID